MDQTGCYRWIVSIYRDANKHFLYIYYLSWLLYRNYQLIIILDKKNTCTAIICRYPCVNLVLLTYLLTLHRMLGMTLFISRRLRLLTGGSYKTYGEQMGDTYDDVSSIPWLTSAFKFGVLMSSLCQPTSFQPETRRCFNYNFTDKNENVIYSVDNFMLPHATYDAIPAL